MDQSRRFETRSFTLDPMTSRARAVVAVVAVLAVFWASTSPTLAQSGSGPEERRDSGSSIALTGVTLHVAPGLSNAHRQTVTRALEHALEAVPRITGLPPFVMPIEAYVLESEEAFREALIVRANVPIERVADEITGYAIERDGVMLLFFDGNGMDQPEIAAFAFAHETGPPRRARGDTAPSSAAMAKRGLRSMGRISGARRGGARDGGRIRGDGPRRCQFGNPFGRRAPSLGVTGNAFPLQHGRDRGLGGSGIRAEHTVRRLAG